LCINCRSMASKILSTLAWANGVAASNVTVGDGLCPGSYATSPESDWLWDRGTKYYPSCTSPGVVNNAQQCHGDPTSVIFRANGNPECLATQMSACKFNMYNLQRLDFDITLQNCLGTWAAPLWLTPDYWAGGGMSGEIDMVEVCPTSSLHSNFAGVYPPTGYEVAWNYDANSFAGHVTMVIENGKVTVSMCSSVGGHCSTTNGGAVYENIYASNACSGHDCVYTFISDIWNGNSGDGGYWGCAGGHTTPGSTCEYSIRNIRAKAPEGTFPASCSALTSGSSPTPSPPPPPSPSPAPSGSCNVGDLVTCVDGFTCMGNQCCRDGSTCPSASSDFTACSGKKSDCTR
jgi:hypothetical protein